MAFWSSQRIEAEQKKQPLIEVEKFNRDRIKCGAYELSLSREVLTTPDGTTETLALTDRALKIPPGKFALLYTEEQIFIPKNVRSFISIKASVKFKGLLNISGFHVDPGFSGRLKFSVQNAGTFDVHINYGEPCFLIWFADLDVETRDPYAGEHRGQKGITAADRDWMAIPNLSLRELSNEIREIKHTQSIINIVGGTVIVAIVIPVALLIIQHFVEDSKTTESQKSPTQLQMNAYGIPSQPSSGTNPPPASLSSTNPNTAVKTAPNP
jgi:dCTP deaminase